MTYGCEVRFVVRYGWKLDLVGCLDVKVHLLTHMSSEDGSPKFKVSLAMHHEMLQVLTMQ